MRDPTTHFRYSAPFFLRGRKEIPSPPLKNDECEVRKIASTKSEFWLNQFFVKNIITHYQYKNLNMKISIFFWYA